MLFCVVTHLIGRNDRGIATLNWEENGLCMVAWHTLDENEYTNPNKTVLKPVSSAFWHSIEVSAGVLARDVKSGDSKGTAQQSIALPLVT